MKKSPEGLFFMGRSCRRQRSIQVGLVAARRPVLLDAPARQHLAHHLGRKPPRHQKTGLPGPFGGLGRHAVKALAPHAPGPRQLGVAQPGQRLLHRLALQALGLQLLAQTPRPQARSPAVQQRLDHALLVDEATGLQLVQRLGQFAGHLFVGCQLALQLGARMLAHGQIAQGPPLERDLFKRHWRSARPGPHPTAGPRAEPVHSASAAAAGLVSAGGSRAMPRLSRTLFSISRARSGFSRRNSRALSRPWPIFSPLWAYQAPDFSMILAVTPMSMISPWRLMPSPNRMSNSAVLNGGETLFFTTFTLVSLPIDSSPFLMVPVRRMSRRTEA